MELAANPGAPRQFTEGDNASLRGVMVGSLVDRAILTAMLRLLARDNPVGFADLQREALGIIDGTQQDAARRGLVLNEHSQLLLAELLADAEGLFAEVRKTPRRKDG